MRSYKIHACTPDKNGRIPFVIVSLCGKQRVSIDMAGLQAQTSAANDAVALSMDALYDLLQGKCIKIERSGSSISLTPTGPVLVIQKDGTVQTHKVWMAEIALAWNMLVGYDTRTAGAQWNIQ